MANNDMSRGWFGHPRGLSTLFFTEMWERFSYYGMRAILLLFMTAPAAAGGLGWEVAKAGPVYGLYTSMVYLAALPGGWIADRFIGARRAVVAGGVLIALGHLSLTVHHVGFFYGGLMLIVAGTGLLKPNISTMVGFLYAEGDPRRDAGFSIFYMGINLGAFIAPLVCGSLAQSERFRALLQAAGLRPESSWHWGFGAAMLGMTLGIVQFLRGAGRLGSAGVPAPAPRGAGARGASHRRPAPAALAAIGSLAVLAALHAAGVFRLSTEGVTAGVGYALVAVPALYLGGLVLGRSWSAVERKRLAAVLILFVFAALFWSAFEQAGSSLNLFAERFTRTEIFGLRFPASWLQSVNSLFLILLSPVFAWLWPALGRREPSSPAKFALGLLFVGGGFLVISLAAVLSVRDGTRVDPAWLVSLYFLHTVGELCLSPVGLSAMTKLAPARVVGQTMGLWFLALSAGNFIGGRVAGLFEALPLPRLFGAVAIATLCCSAIAFALVRPIRRLMGGVS
jgi:POT family proton-dependent oligopeptide transporter